MYIISINENLLERLKLLIQSSPLGDESNGDNIEKTTFISCLSKERNLCGPSDKFIILIGKEWDKTSIETISDITRRIMSMNNNGKILIIKKDMNNDDKKELKILIDNVHEEWKTEWNYQYEKVKKLGNSNAKNEMIEKMNKWISPVEPMYSIIDFEDPSLHDQIKDYFSIKNVMNIIDYSSLDKPKLITKPPALHWTNYPREAEIQVSFKFTFMPGTLHEDLFRNVIKEANQCHEWEYSYEWINGILFKEDLIKITVIRNENHNLEISGRIDKDEVGEEDYTASYRPVWPYLARVFKVIYHLLENYPSLPYTLNIVFIGDIFFEKPKNNSDENVLNARSLDAVQTLGALERVKSVRFKVGDYVHALDLKQAFPDFEPKVLADFWLQNANEPKNKKIEKIQSPKVSTIDSTPTHNMNNLNVNKNRGRRVSFGGIRDIPTTSGPTLLRSGSNNALEMPSQLQIPEITSGNSGSEDESSSIPERSNHKQHDNSESHRSSSPNTLSEYVDNIVQKTIDEVLVLE